MNTLNKWRGHRDEIERLHAINVGLTGALEQAVAEIKELRRFANNNGGMIDNENDVSEYTAALKGGSVMPTHFVTWTADGEECRYAGSEEDVREIRHFMLLRPHQRDDISEVMPVRGDKL